MSNARANFLCAVYLRTRFCENSEGNINTNIGVRKAGLSYGHKLHLPVYRETAYKVSVVRDGIHHLHLNKTWKYRIFPNKRWQ